MAHGGFGPTAFAAAGLIVWIACLVGLAIGVFPRSEIPGFAIGTGLALAGLAALMALSLAWASDDGDAFGDVVRTLAYLGAFVVVVLASQRGEARPWLAGLTIGLVAIGVIALLARFVPGPFGDPDADLARDLPAALGRLTYPIGYWNGLAAVMSAAIVLLLLVRRRGAHGPRPGARRRRPAARAPGAVDDRLARRPGGGGARLHRPAAGRPGAVAADRQPRHRGGRRGGPDRGRRGLRDDPQRPARQRQPGHRHARDHDRRGRRHRRRPTRDRRAASSASSSRARLAAWRSSARSWR